MGCEFGITIAGEDSRQGRAAAAGAAFEVLDAIEGELSHRTPLSDVARINALPPGRWTAIGLETTACLRLARRAWRLTGGAFDAGFARGGLRRVVLDARRHRVKVSAPVTLDFGALGKGYALDRMGAVLREWGIASAFLQSGGSTGLVLGPPPAGGWRVGLRHPLHPARSLGTATLRSGALSGSGMQAQGPHIVDPGTGRPAVRPAAWAWAPAAALSDALSTAFMVMPVAAIRGVCAGGGAVGIIAASGAGPIRLARFGHGPGVTFEMAKGGRR
jgi:thiamine biosynthesis lipoprotein